MGWPLRFLETGMKPGEQSDVYELRVGVGATGLFMLGSGEGVDLYMIETWNLELKAKLINAENT